MSENSSLLDIAMMLEAKAERALQLDDYAIAAAFYQAAATYRCADFLGDIAMNMPEPPS